MPDYVGPLTELDRRIRETVGDEAADAIMDGLVDVKNSWKRDRVAHWVKEAMARMDETLDDEAKEKIMVACGHNCAAHHGAPIGVRSMRGSTSSSTPWPRSLPRGCRWSVTEGP